MTGFPVKHLHPFPRCDELPIATDHDRNVIISPAPCRTGRGGDAVTGTLGGAFGRSVSRCSDSPIMQGVEQT
jgi:hypothetical protein